MSDIAERVKKIVVEHLGVEEDKVTEEASFIDDLGADSLDTVELVMAFEEEFGVEIPDDAAETILTVGDAVKLPREERGLSSRVALSRNGRWRSGGGACGASSSPAWAWSRRSAAASRRPGRASSPARAAPRASSDFEVDDLPARSPARSRAATAPNGTFNPDHSMEPKEQRKVDDFIIFAMAAADEALDDAGWQPETRGRAVRDRRADRLGHRRHRRHRTRPRSRCTRRARAASRPSSSRAG